MFQDLQRFFRGSHSGGLHSALLGDRGASLTDGLLVIHDKNVHRDNFAADCCFLSHGRDHKSLGLRLYVDRKSTRLNSSHTVISYAVFCLKKKKKKTKVT